MQIIVGVRKNNNWFTAVMGGILFVFMIALFVCWSAYYINYPYSWLKEYGIEVEAIIDDVEEYRSGTHVHDGADTDYYCWYRYVADDGTTYRGRHGRYDT